MFIDLDMYVYKEHQVWLSGPSQCEIQIVSDTSEYGYTSGNWTLKC